MVGEEAELPPSPPGAPSHDSPMTEDRKDNDNGPNNDTTNDIDGGIVIGIVSAPTERPHQPMPPPSSETQPMLSINTNAESRANSVADNSDTRDLPMSQSMSLPSPSLSPHSQSQSQAMKHTEESAALSSEQAQVMASFEKLQSSNLEKRIAGLHAIGKFIDTASRQVISYDEWQRRSTVPFLSMPAFAHYISETGLVSLLFGATMHSQLLRRCHGILRTLCQHNQLTQPQLSLIWSQTNQSQGHHESVIQQLYIVLLAIVPDLKNPLKMYLMKLIAALPMSELNVSHMNVLRALLVSDVDSMDHHNVVHHQHCRFHTDTIIDTSTGTNGDSNSTSASESLTVVGMKFLWSLLNVSNIDLQLRNTCFECFRQLIPTMPFCQYRLPYLMACMRNVSEQRNVSYSIGVMQEIIETYSHANHSAAASPSQQLTSHHTMKQSAVPAVDERSLVINWLCTKFDLIEKLFTELLTLQVQSQSQSMPVAYTPQYLEHRYFVIRYLQQHSNNIIQFTQSQIFNLWNTFVMPIQLIDSDSGSVVVASASALASAGRTEPTCSDVTLLWLVQCSFLPSQPIPHTLTAFIFHHLLPLCPAHSMSLTEWLLFETLFLIMNNRQNLLIEEWPGVEQLPLQALVDLPPIAFQPRSLPSSMIGSDRVWDVACHSENDAVTRRAWTLLQRMHSHLPYHLINPSYEASIKEAMTRIETATQTFNNHTHADTIPGSGNELMLASIEIDRCFTIIGLLFDEFTLAAQLQQQQSQSQRLLSAPPTQNQPKPGARQSWWLNEGEMNDNSSGSESSSPVSPLLTPNSHVHDLDRDSTDDSDVDWDGWIRLDLSWHSSVISFPDWIVVPDYWSFKTILKALTLRSMQLDHLAPLGGPVPFPCHLVPLVCAVSGWSTNDDDDSETVVAEINDLRTNMTDCTILTAGLNTTTDSRGHKHCELALNFVESLNRPIECPFKDCSSRHLRGDNMNGFQRPEGWYTKCPVCRTAIEPTNSRMLQLDHSRQFVEASVRNVFKHYSAKYNNDLHAFIKTFLNLQSAKEQTDKILLLLGEKSSGDKPITVNEPVTRTHSIAGSENKEGEPMTDGVSDSRPLQLEPLISPAVILSRPEYFDQLFALLSLQGSGQLSELCWALLQRLPVNQMMQTRILSLTSELKSPVKQPPPTHTHADIHTESKCEIMSTITDTHGDSDDDSGSVDWDRLFDCHNVAKLRYSLTIVELFLSNHLPSIQHSHTVPLTFSQWLTRFVSKGGLKHLTQILLANQFLQPQSQSQHRSFHDALSLQCLQSITALIEIIIEFFRFQSQSHNDTERPTSAVASMTAAMEAIETPSAGTMAVQGGDESVDATMSESSSSRKRKSDDTAAAEEMGSKRHKSVDMSAAQSTEFTPSQHSPPLQSQSQFKSQWPAPLHCLLHPPLVVKLVEYMHACAVLPHTILPAPRSQSQPQPGNNDEGSPQLSQQSVARTFLDSLLYCRHSHSRSQSQSQRSKEKDNSSQRKWFPFRDSQSQSVIEFNMRLKFPISNWWKVEHDAVSSRSASNGVSDIEESQWIHSIKIDDRDTIAQVYRSVTALLETILTGTLTDSSKSSVSQLSLNDTGALVILCHHCLLDSPNPLIRAITGEFLYHRAKHSSTFLHSVLSHCVLLLEGQPLSQFQSLYKYKCHSLFVLLTRLYLSVIASNDSQLDWISTEPVVEHTSLYRHIYPLIRSLIAKLMITALPETDDSHCDQSLNGLLWLLGVLVHASITYSQNLSNNDIIIEFRSEFNPSPIPRSDSPIVEMLEAMKFVEFLYQWGLFSSQQAPLFQSLSTRQSALTLLLYCVNGSETLFTQLTQQIALTHSQPRRDLIAANQWNYDPILQKKESGIPYVGLHNLGATCYMNALMQQLFFVEPFRYGLFVQSHGDSSAKLDDSLHYQLQLLMANLQESVSKFYDARSFCAAYRDYEGQCMQHNIQMDVNEFANILFDQLEKELKSHRSKQDTLLQSIFGGAITNQMICQECGNQSERLEDYLMLSLDVKNKHSILNSLSLYTEGELLQGDNKASCSKCNKKVDTVKRVCIKTLPPHLILHLKRFEFDLDTMRKYKVNDFCEFPDMLDMKPFTQEGLEQKEKASTNNLSNGSASAIVSNGSRNEEMKSAQSGGELMQTEEDTGTATASSTTEYVYELSGVLVHTGTCNSGHYYSLVKDRHSRWFTCNDTSVDVLDPATMRDTCFGGNFIETGIDPTTRKPTTTCYAKPYSAYMLFYERVDIAAAKRQQQLAEAQSLSHSQSLTNSVIVDRRSLASLPSSAIPEHLDPVNASALIPSDILTAIRAHNTQLTRDCLIFDSQYFDWLMRFSLCFDRDIEQLLSAADRQSYEQCRLSLCDASVKFLFNTYIHSQLKAQSFAQFIDGLSENTVSSVALSVSLVQALADNIDWLRSYLLQCQSLQLRKKINDWLIASISVIQSASEHSLHPSVQAFLNSLLWLVPVDVQENTRSCAQYWSLLHELMQVNDLIADFVFHYPGIFRWLILFIIGCDCDSAIIPECAYDHDCLPLSLGAAKQKHDENKPDGDPFGLLCYLKHGDSDGENELIVNGKELRDISSVKPGDWVYGPSGEKRWVKQRIDRHTDQFENRCALLFHGERQDYLLADMCLVTNRIETGIECYPKCIANNTSLMPTDPQHPHEFLRTNADGRHWVSQLRQMKTKRKRFTEKFRSYCQVLEVLLSKGWQLYDDRDKDVAVYEDEVPPLPFLPFRLACQISHESVIATIAEFRPSAPNIAVIISLLATNNYRVCQSTIALLMTMLEEETHSTYGTIFPIIHSFLAIEDRFAWDRIDELLRQYGALMKRNDKYDREYRMLLSSLRHWYDEEKKSSTPLLRIYRDKLVEAIMSRVIELPLLSTKSQYRQDARALLLTLARSDSLPHYPRPDTDTGGEKDMEEENNGSDEEANMTDNINITAKTRTKEALEKPSRVLFDYLLSFWLQTKPLIGKRGNDKSLLADYYHCINTILIDHSDYSTAFDATHITFLLESIKQFETANRHLGWDTKNDESRKEILTLLSRLCDLHPIHMAQVTLVKVPSVGETGASLLASWQMWHESNNQLTVNYNESAVTTVYELLDRCARQSPEFALSLTQHTTVLWAVRTLAVQSGRTYPKCSAAILNLLQTMASVNIEGDWRRKLLSTFVSPLLVNASKCDGTPFAEGAPHYSHPTNNQQTRQAIHRSLNQVLELVKILSVTDDDCAYVLQSNFLLTLVEYIESQSVDSEGFAHQQVLLIIQTLLAVVRPFARDYNRSLVEKLITTVPSRSLSASESKSQASDNEDDTLDKIVERSFNQDECMSLGKHLSCWLLSQTQKIYVTWRVADTSRPPFVATPTELVQPHRFPHLIHLDNVPQTLFKPSAALVEKIQSSFSPLVRHRCGMALDSETLNGAVNLVQWLLFSVNDQIENLHSLCEMIATLLLSDRQAQFDTDFQHFASLSYQPVASRSGSDSDSGWHDDGVLVSPMMLAHLYTAQSHSIYDFTLAAIHCHVTPPASPDAELPSHADSEPDPSNDDADGCRSDQGRDLRLYFIALCELITYHATQTIEPVPDDRLHRYFAAFTEHFATLLQSTDDEADRLLARPLELFQHLAVFHLSPLYSVRPILVALKPRRQVFYHSLRVPQHQQFQALFASRSARVERWLDGGRDYLAQPRSAKDNRKRMTLLVSLIENLLSLCQVWHTVNKAMGTCVNDAIERLDAKLNAVFPADPSDQDQHAVLAAWQALSDAVEQPQSRS